MNAPLTFAPLMRHALRRLLWIVPILIGVTLASFALLSYVPDPADDPALLVTLSQEQITSLRRARFLDLPRFFNNRPLDIAGRVDATLAREGTLDPARLQADLVHLGGAALPHLLPRLDALPPQGRTRVAAALGPVAERMGIAPPQGLPASQAVAFWNRFWTDRAADFRPTSARRAVRRFAQHGTASRATDVFELDTYALEPIMTMLEELAAPETPGTGAATTEKERLHAVSRLVLAASHVAARDDKIAEGASEREALACIGRWREWWLVHQADYKSQEGASRFLAMLTETQYARWAERAVMASVGNGGAGSGVFERMSERAPKTLLLMGTSLFFAYTLAMALAVLGAIRAEARFEIALSAGALAAFATPTACLALWSVHRMGPRLAIAFVVLSLPFVAAPFAQAESWLAEAARSDVVRTARALGYSPLQIVVGQTLRSAILPVLALGSVELPVALGATFVVEKTFGIAGLGEETVRAVQTHDVAWLVGLAFLTALTVTITSIVADFAVAASDPRLTLAALRHRRVSA